MPSDASSGFGDGARRRNRAVVAALAVGLWLALGLTLVELTGIGASAAGRLVAQLAVVAVAAAIAGRFALGPWGRSIREPASRREAMHDESDPSSEAGQRRRIAQVALDRASDAVFWVRFDGRFEYVNEMACQSLGYSRNELLDKYVWDVDPVVTREVWPSVVGRARSVISLHLDTCHRRKDGQEFPVDITGNVLEFDGQKLICAFARDMSERRDAELQLRESEHRLRNLIEGTEVILWETSLESMQFTYVSGHFEQILGYPESAWYTKDFWIEKMHPEDREWAPEYCLAETRKKQDHVFEYRMVAADGRVVWLRDLVSVILEDDEPVGLRGALVDITEEKLAEEKLRESEQRLREVAHHLPGVVCSFDNREGEPRTLVYLGPGLDEMIGQQAAQAAVEDIERLFERIFDADRSRLEAATASAQGDQSTVDTEFRVRHDSGRWRWLRWVARAIRIDATTCRWHVVMIDVTERHETQIQLEQTNSTLQLLLSELDHRVKNSLSGLLSLIDLMQGRSASVEEFGRSIRRRVRTMSATHSLLSEAHWRPVDFARLCDTVFPSDVMGQLTLDGPPIAIPSRQVTATGMILNELLQNSLEHGALSTPAGRITLSWVVDHADDWARVMLDWTERNGPTIRSEPESGLGMRLIEGFCASELGGRAVLRFPQSGADHRLFLTLDVDGQGASETASVERSARQARETPAAT